MSENTDSVEQAQADAREARTQISATLGELQGRLTPRSLLHGAWSGIRARGDRAAEDVAGLARRRPGAVAGVAAALAALVLRRPIARATKGLFSRKRATEPSSGRLKNTQADDAAAARRRRVSTRAKGD